MNYPHVESAKIDMSISIEACHITDIEKSVIEKVTIEPNGQETIMIFDDWIVHGNDACQFLVWEYRAYYQNVEIEASTIASIVQFDSIKRQFTFSSTIAGQTYTITVRGDLSGGDISASLEFILEVASLEVAGNT